jgi:hypothetical protein
MWYVRRHEYVVCKTSYTYGMYDMYMWYLRRHVYVRRHACGMTSCICKTSCICGMLCKTPAQSFSYVV